MAHTTNAVPSALQHFDSLPDSAYVRLPVVQALIGCSSATVWRMSKRGDLPAPRKISDSITAWNVGELRQSPAIRGPAAAQGRCDKDRQALTTCITVRSLVVATTRLADAVHDHVVTFATRHGSTTAPAVRYIHFVNATARAIGLKKSDATVIDALPRDERAILALVRQGVAARIPAWAAQVESEGGTKPHNKILALAKQWVNLEVKALRACGVEAVVSQAESLLALEQ